ncbi:MAG: HlyC/CorC family transporter [Opitutaceae bacterium]|jgi:CBS domain containing-hemolysin-like protein|nr:HlyC/CorC family transporter [Opitutaceae bacterium]
MTLLLTAIILTVSVSFICSLSEALILSTTVAEIESLKKARPQRGERLERLKLGLEETISTILTLNTMANTLGSVIIGGLATRMFGDAALGAISAALTIIILIFAEVLPKSIGVSYRRALQPHFVYPMWYATRALRPVTYVSNLVVRLFIGPAKETNDSDEEIILLAERGAQRGTLTRSESSIITNALALDDVRVSEIMTPRTVVTALRKQATINEVFREYPNVPFGRMPVFGRSLDDVVGLVRRRDLLKAKANDQDLVTVESLMQEVHFIPETVTAANALQVFLKTHQQLLVVVDEFGSTSGVVTMEDVMEQLLGREIFEKDDVAVDMRELARAKLQRQSQPRGRRPADGAVTPFSPPPKP